MVAHLRARFIFGGGFLIARVRLPGPLDDADLGDLAAFKQLPGNLEAASGHQCDGRRIQAI